MWQGVEATSGHPTKRRRADWHGEDAAWKWSQGEAGPWHGGAAETSGTWWRAPEWRSPEALAAALRLLEGLAADASAPLMPTERSAIHDVVLIVGTLPGVAAPVQPSAPPRPTCARTLGPAAEGPEARGSAVEAPVPKEDDEESPQSKQRLVDRVLEILRANAGCLSIPKLANHPRIQALLSRRRKGWFRQVLAEREDAVRLAGDPPLVVCLPGVEPEPDALQSRHSAIG